MSSKERFSSMTTMMCLICGSMAMGKPSGSRVAGIRESIRRGLERVVKELSQELEFLG
jgi:hypothetical protein